MNKLHITLFLLAFVLWFHLDERSYGEDAVGVAHCSNPDYTTMERDIIARAKSIELVFWGEESIDHRATISESDKGRIQDLLLNRTRYVKPLEMSREEYWDDDDGIVPPIRFLNFIGEDGQSQLELFIGDDIVSERKMECRRCVMGMEMLMDNESYNQLQSIIDEYTPLEARKELSDARVDDW